jgi:glutamine amidotransferase-like uncharacterized protein
MPTALLYQDFIHNNYPVYRALRKTFGAQNTAFCTADEVRGGRLQAGDVAVFVLPGGADVYYVEKLEGEGNRQIRSYVESGGRYLGICGGAYYAARSIAYAKGSAHEVAGPRALGFFPGLAVGPVGESAPLDREGFPPPRILGLLDPMSPEPIAAAVYWGGPAFVGHDRGGESGSKASGQTVPAVEVLARYDTPETDRPLPAIVRCAVGRGRAVLCGIHPEITPDDLENMDYAIDDTGRPFTRAAAQLRAACPPTTGQPDPRALWSRVVDWTMEP